MEAEEGNAADLRVVFMGTPDFAVPPLRALHAMPGVSIPLVISQPDRPRGRGQALQPTPVKAAAEALGLDVAQPASMRADEAAELLRAAAPDLAVVVAYGQILDERILSTPTLGCVNVHASLLPRWRGAAPIQRAIEAGDAVTGVSIMQMERGLDTGPVFAMAATMIGDTETAGELHDRLASLGAELLISTLAHLREQSPPPVPQADSRACYAAKIGSADRTIEFSDSPLLVASRINAMSPWPGINATVDDMAISLLRARPVLDSNAGDEADPGTILAADGENGLLVACRGGVVEILELKRAGKRSLSSREFLNGAALPVGARVRGA